MATDEKLEALDVARAAGGDASPRAAKGESVYTVQMRGVHGIDVKDGTTYCWKDIATVTVPQRTPRRVVYREALKLSGLKPAPDSEPLRLRALDAASAGEQLVEPFQPEAEWKVS